MKKILIVDNNPVFLGFMGKLLDREGLQVETATDGLNALDVLKGYTPDMAFIDLVMPNINGGILSKIIRNMERFRDVYLVTLSAISAEEWSDIARLDVNACIAKGPLDETARHVLYVIEHPGEAASRYRSGEILGIEGVYPRAITGELLSIKRHLEVLLEKMSEGILEINPEGRIIYANPATSSMINLPEKKLLGSAFMDLFSDEEKKWVANLIKKNDAGENIITNDSPVLLNGSLITLKTFPLDPNAANHMVILHDVTEQKQAEGALRSAKEYAQNIITSSLDMIIAVDNNRNIVEFNRAAETSFGYRKDEVIGKSVEMLYANPEEGKTLREKGLNTENFVGEISNIRKDGSTFVSLLSVSFMKDKEGEVIGSVGVSRDITERRVFEKELENHREHLAERVEERTRALKESEAKYRNILDRIEDAYFEVDLAGNFTFINNATMKITGYTEKELMGMNYREYMDEGTAGTINRTFNEVYRKGEATQAFDWKLIKKDGSDIYANILVSLKIDSEGIPEGFRGIARDVTERKLAAIENERLQTQLQQAHKMESIGTLAGGIAHDFNNLLMGMQGRLSLILLDDDIPTSHTEHLNGIEDYIKSAASLTKQLLGFARGGKYELRTTDLNGVIKKQNRMFGRTRKEITIRGKYAADLWGADVDIGQIEQMLLNLYVNAWQSMPGGGSLQIRTENVFLDENHGHPYFVEPGRYIKISVSDSGIGMDEETQKRIFDPFFTTKEMGRGTGLGLASAYGIIKNHGGFITVKSKKGEGTTFHIYLPASAKNIVAEKAPTGKILRGSETVLLVDDEEMIVDVAREILKSLGYTVLCAGGGKEALNLYRKHRDEIDIVILDMVMPDLSGGDTYDRMKLLNPKIKVLLASGYSIKGQATEILNRGCNGFIQKPFNIDNLSQKVRTILDDIA